MTTPPLDFPKPSPPPQRWRTEHLRATDGRMVTPSARQAEVNRSLAAKREENDDRSNKV